MATRIDGKALASAIRDRVKREAAELRSFGITPTLANLLAGGDGGAESYAEAQGRTARDLGIDYRLVRLPASASARELESALDNLNQDRAVSGILLSQPTPPGIDAFALQQRIAPAKDVEGVSAANLGMLMMGHPALHPCTAAAAVECVRATGTNLVGAGAVVVGRSNIVGKPVAALLLAAHATVTQCHSRTRDLPAVTRAADILIVAIGRPEIIGRDHVKPGAVVVDVGTNRITDASGKSRIVGDVRFDEVDPVAGWITPVPGGVGPLTVAMLMSNVVQAARRAKG